LLQKERLMTLRLRLQSPRLGESTKKAIIPLQVLWKGHESESDPPLM